MSTKKTTDTTRKFDPGSMSRFQQWGGGLLPGLLSLFQRPTDNPFFATDLAQSQGAARTLGLRAIQNAMRGFDLSGMGDVDSPMRNALMARQSRFASGLGYQGWLDTMNRANQNRWMAAQVGSGLFGQPLETGQSTVQKTSGLGTWLPQLFSAGLSIAAPFMGGMGGAMGGLGQIAGSPTLSTIGGLPSSAYGGLSALTPTVGSSFWNPSGFGGFGGRGGPCWVAAELYGLGSPEMLAIRQWLLETPIMRPFVWLYSAIGEHWAAAIRQHTWLRKPTAALFRVFLKLATGR